MSNSSLVNYVKISPNSTNPRNNTIKKITIHHMAGNLTVEQCGNVFAPTSRRASSNYGIGSDGRVGMYVEEKNRSWCSNNGNNDNQAITIEVANDGGANTNWHVSDKALNKLVELCVDICKRNGIAKLNYTGDATGNLTMHKWFAATSCPGPYLESKFPWIAEQVNKKLNASATNTNSNTTSTKPATSASSTTTTSVKFAVGDVVQLTPGAKYTSGKSVPSWLMSSKLYVRKIGANGDLTVSILKVGPVTGIVNQKYLSKISSSTSYKVKVTADVLNIRAGAGTNYKVVGCIKDKGVYTIIAENNGWGQLKSKAGWISLTYTKKV